MAKWGGVVVCRCEQENGLQLVRLVESCAACGGGRVGGGLLHVCRAKGSTRRARLWCAPPHAVPTEHAGSRIAQLVAQATSVGGERFSGESVV